MPNQSDPNPNQTNNQTVPPQTDTVSPPPISVQNADLPPLPDFTNNDQPSSHISDNSPPSLPPMVTTPKKKFGGGKIIATILGILVLVGGIGGGVYLTKQQQSITPKAGNRERCGDLRQACGPGQASCRQEYSSDCVTDEGGSPCPPDQTLTQTTHQVHSCIRIGSCRNKGGIIGDGCTDDEEGSRVDCTVTKPVWICMPVPTPTPGPTAQCLNVKAYSSSWALLTNAQLSALTVGSTINFCVAGSTTANSFDKAQFRINTTLKPETTTKRPTTNDYCQSYTISQTDTIVNVKAKIHHSTLGWFGESI